MSVPRFTLATADEIRAIFRRAVDLLDQISDHESDSDREPGVEHELDGRDEPVFEALRFCCVAAGQLGDPSLFPLIADVLAIVERYTYAYDDIRKSIPTAIAWLLQAGAPADDYVKAFASHRSSQVRWAVARRLLPRGEREIAILERLALDPVPDVRNAARDTLAPVRPVAWWKGKFSRDPALRLSVEEASLLGTTLAKISEILDGRSYHSGARGEELLELSRSLPDELLVDMAETIHSSLDKYGSRHRALLSLMLERHGGVDAWMRLLRCWLKDGRHYRGDELVAIVQALPREHRARVCWELARGAASAKDDPEENELSKLGRAAASIAGKAWPPGEDLSGLLDIALTMPPSPSGRLHGIALNLGNAFISQGADAAPILERALEARVAGYPGAWKNIATAIDALLDRSPGEMIRGAVERAIISDDDSTVAWGLRRLLSRAYDEVRDGPRDDLLRRILAEPKYRRVFFRSSAYEIALPFMREELRRGALDFHESTWIVECVGRLYGGVAVYSLEDRWIAEFRKKRLEELDAYLGPPEARCPPTEAEWRRLREARDRWMAEGFPPREGRRHALGVVPDGPWGADDRGALDAAMRASRERSLDGDDELAIAIAAALRLNPTPDALELCDVLLKQSEPSARHLIKYCCEDIREAMGLPPREPAEGDASRAAPLEGAGEWMDEPEDDEEE